MNIKVVACAGVLLVAACASSDGVKTEAPKPTTSTPQERVTLQMERIRTELEAGREAKAKCGDLGLQADEDCRADLSRAYLGRSSKDDVPVYTRKAAE